MKLKVFDKKNEAQSSQITKEQLASSSANTQGNQLNKTRNEHPNEISAPNISRFYFDPINLFFYLEYRD